MLESFSFVLSMVSDPRSPIPNPDFQETNLTAITSQYFRTLPWQSIGDLMEGPRCPGYKKVVHASQIAHSPS